MVVQEFQSVTLLDGGGYIKKQTAEAVWKTFYLTRGIVLCVLNLTVEGREVKKLRTCFQERRKNHSCMSYSKGI